MRKIKYFTILLTIVALVLALLIYVKKDKAIYAEVKPETTIPKQHIVDKEVVIETLKDKFQIVGLEGQVKKEFEFKDEKWYGNKNFQMELHGSFKMGFNIDDITREDITIIDNNIIINMPDIKLISLELPYDKIKINKDIGMFRTDFTEKDRQFLYSIASDSAKKEILNDKLIHRNSVVASQEAIKQILLLIPEVNNVLFK